MHKIENEIITCIRDSSGMYKHFNIHEKTLSLYGSYKNEDILNVRVRIHEDQSPADEKSISAPDYWAWVDSKGKISSLIWAQYFLLNMCFPYGLKAEEERGAGKAYRVTITEIK